MLYHKRYFICYLSLELSNSSSTSAGEGVDKEVVEGAAVYLIEIFKSVEKVGQKETNSLKSVFGPFPASVATKTCGIVNRITNSLPDHVIELLGNSREEADGAATIDEFGQAIKFVLPVVNGCNDEISSSDDSEEDSRREYNLQYTATNTAQSNRSSEQKSLSLAEKTIDSAWLQEQVAKAYGNQGSTELGLSVEDLSSTIFDYLSSTKTDSELQNDVRISKKILVWFS